jgi:hypothetical protein
MSYPDHLLPLPKLKVYIDLLFGKTVLRMKEDFMGY